MKWTPEMIEFMRDVIPGHSEAEIRQRFFDRFGIELTRSKIGNMKTRLSLRSNTGGGRFKKGQVPFNKGLKQEEYLSKEQLEVAKQTRFQKGHLPASTLPLGYERINADGYTEVHVALHRFQKANDQWILKHRLIWEREHGPIPDGHNVIFIDGNKQNFAIENLACVSRADMLMLNNGGYRYHDRETLQIALDAVKLHRAACALEKSDRHCRKCGQMFSPRFAHQRTCDVCLGRKEKKQ